MTPREFLRRHPPFDRLSDASLAALESALEVRFAAAGELILSVRDAENRFLHVVRKGVVRLERAGRTIELCEAGELFGAPSALAGGSPRFDAVAAEEALIYRFPVEAVRPLLADERVAAFFFESLADRLRVSSARESAALPTDFTAAARSAVHRQPLFVDPETTVAEAARRMSTEHVSSVLVGDHQLGILTDRDLRSRVVARGLDSRTPVRAVMTRPCRTAPAGASLFEVLLEMLEHRIHHLPLVENGEVVGVVTQTDLLRQTTRSPLHLLKSVERHGDTSRLSDFAAEQAAMVERLAAGGLEATRIGRIAASVNDALVARLLRMAEHELGEPPGPYAWMVFGSEGRFEQTLLTDQDNALVYRDDTPEAKEYFGRLAARVVGALLELGFPPCPGGFMATRWCHPLAEWKRKFEGWVSTPEPEALLEASSFFDFRRVHGELSLAPLGEIVEAAREARLFLRLLAQNSLHFRPPLGFLNRVRERESGVDLKGGGLMPIVGLARVRALAAGSAQRSTLDRLEAAVKHGVLRPEAADTLAEAFRFLSRLRLEAQLGARRAGRPPTNSVELESLTALERRHLKDAFVSIRELQEELALDYLVERPA
jgi:CBS domain-containing protein